MKNGIFYICNFTWLNVFWSLEIPAGEQRWYWFDTRVKKQIINLQWSAFYNILYKTTQICFWLRQCIWISNGKWNINKCWNLVFTCRLEGVSNVSKTKTPLVLNDQSISCYIFYSLAWLWTFEYPLDNQLPLSTCHTRCVTIAGKIMCLMMDVVLDERMSQRLDCSSQWHKDVYVYSLMFDMELSVQ